MNLRSFVPPVLAALGLLVPGCGGGSKGASAPAAPTYATSLSYTNPPLTGYSLQALAGTNQTSHLVLNLMGPAGTVVQGVSFFLTADPAKVSWASSGSGVSAYATAGTVFNLGAAPQPFATAISAGGGLQVGIYQKSGTATFAAAPIVSVGLGLASATVPAGSAVALTVTPGQQAVFVDANGTVQPFAAPIAIGTLTAN